MIGGIIREVVKNIIGRYVESFLNDVRDDLLEDLCYYAEETKLCERLGLSDFCVDFLQLLADVLREKITIDARVELDWKDIERINRLLEEFRKLETK